MFFGRYINTDKMRGFSRTCPLLFHRAFELRDIKVESSIAKNVLYEVERQPERVI